ncbi:MAG: hypothetical protein KBA51_09395 [Kiritimatiellae bacterium]|nr:hypothetical protein [Kiritimatiellia bacterium]
MKSTWKTWALGAVTAVALAIPVVVYAKSAKFDPDVRLGQWKVSLEEQLVKTVTVQVQRVRGSDRTFINARFGREGTTFENGRRVYLKDTEWTTVVWNVNQSPNGKQLIINAYDGEVQLRHVKVQF